MTQPRLLGGRYELDGIVGRGGMAEVFRARDIRLDRIVAVKTLREDLARDQTFQARFRREAQSAASLNHPSIVAVYDTGEDMMGHTPVPYIVMEYVDGRTLRDLLRDDRRLLPERALEITDGVLRALDYSHRNGIVHRDIKPGNVMLTRAGDIKVMDFGIARAVSDSQATMTQTAQVIGTAQYLSPEQARGERVDARSDLYSTGCLLYELLTGRPPFTGDSPVAIAYQHVRENPIPPSRIDPEVPPWADSIVLRAMAKSPDARYQSAGEMRSDIQRALQGMPIAAPTRTGYQGTRRMGATQMGGQTGAIPPYDYGPQEEPPGGGGRKAWPWVVAGLVVVALIVGLVYGLNYISGGGGSNFAVPNVVNQSQATAVAEIRSAHLVPVVLQQPSDTEPKGEVIKTNPPAGASVKKGDTVTLYVSTGAQPVAVPNIVGQSYTAAEQTLSAKGFTPNGQKGTSPSCVAQTANTVCTQSPAAGTPEPKGSTVTFTYSPGGTAVPGVVGDTAQQASNLLANDGFSPNVITQAAPAGQGALPGTVWKVSPPVGTSLAPGTTVNIYVEPQPSPSPTSPSPSPSSSSPGPGGGGGGGGTG
jgi:serine/threonine-protein kinase